MRLIYSSASARAQIDVPQTAALSASELRWHLLKPARYCFSKGFSRRRPQTARRMHFGGWEIR